MYKYQKGWYLFFIYTLIYSFVTNAQSPNEYFLKGLTLYESQQFGASIENFNLALLSKPDWEKPLFTKGKALLELGSYNLALDCFATLQNMKPTEAHYEYYRGRCEWKLNRINVAIEHLEKAILYSPNHFEAHQTLGYIYQELKLLDKAKYHYDLALEAQPAFHTSIFNKSKVKNNISDYKTALHEYNHDIENSPNDVMGYLNRGILREIGHENQGAYEDFSKCISIDPTFILAFYYRGISNFNLGNFKESQKDLEIYLKIFPKDEHARSQLELVKKNIVIKLVSHSR